MMVVTIEAAPDPRPSRPKLLFETPRSNEDEGYDVARDGRLLMVEEVPPEPMPDHLSLIVNWFEEIRRLAPTR